ncbi:hypothetical protein VTH82DRAFT_1668 [Thermothelomyces myriococcoides]
MRSFLAAQLPRGGKGEDGAARTGQPRGRKGKRRQGWCCCIEWKTKQEAAGGGNRILLTDVSRTIALVGRGVHGVWRDSEKEKQSRVEVDQRPASRSLRAPPIAFHYPIWEPQRPLDPAVAEAQIACGQRLVWADPLRRTSEVSFGTVTLSDRRGSQAQSAISFGVQPG